MAQAPMESLTPPPDGTPTTLDENRTEVSNSIDDTVESLAGLVTQLVTTMSIERVVFWIMFLLYGGYLLAKATPTKRDDAVFEALINLLKNKQDKP